MTRLRWGATWRPTLVGAALGLTWGVVLRLLGFPAHVWPQVIAGGELGLLAVLGRLMWTQQ